MTRSREARPRRSRKVLVVSGAVVALLVLAAGSAWDFAAPLGIERLPVVAGLVGPRTAVTLALTVAGVLLAAAAAAARPARLLLGPAAAALLVTAAVSWPTVVGRGFGNDRPAALGPHTVRILSWNINGALVPPERIARLAATLDADVVVLPEITPASDGSRYATAFAGLHMTAYPAIADQPIATVVLVRDRFGTYSSRIGHDAVPWKNAALTPLQPALPRIVAIHAAQPTLADNAQWRADLAWITRACRDPDTIAVGDFNATVDSLGRSRLGTCTDAASTRHAASTGTWPTRLPAAIGMPLDHVLAGADWTVRSWTIVTGEDDSGARHRPVFAVLAPAGR